LPPEIGQLTNLQELDIESNRLRALPSEIAELQSLEKISLLNNAIQEDFSAVAALANHPNQNLEVTFLVHLSFLLKFLGNTGLIGTSGKLSGY
jgi:Leucine-rich repeat (LRR) protein